MGQLLTNMTNGRALVVGAVICVLYYLISYNSGANEETAITQTTSQIESLRNEVKATEEKLARAQVYKQTIGTMGQTLNQLLSYIPEKLSTPDLMKLLSNEAKAAGTNIMSLQSSGTVSDPAPGSFYQELKVDLSLQGTFPQHMQFLSFLTRVDQILTVERFGITVNQQSANPLESPTTTFGATVRGYKYTGGESKATGQ